MFKVGDEVVKIGRRKNAKTGVITEIYNKTWDWETDSYVPSYVVKWGKSTSTLFCMEHQLEYALPVNIKDYL